jgi:hypothetical protein
LESGKHPNCDRNGPVSLQWYGIRTIFAPNLPALSVVMYFSQISFNNYLPIKLVIKDEHGLSACKKMSKNI